MQEKVPYLVDCFNCFFLYGFQTPSSLLTEPALLEQLSELVSLRVIRLG